jgi:hypothetical protein
MKSIDLSPLPLAKNGNYDWQNSIGKKLRFQYEDIIGEIEIIGYKKRNNKVRIRYQDREREYNYSKIIYCSFSDILENKNSYRFTEGEIIKGFLIIEPLLEDHQRAYKVVCQKCNKESIMKQSKLIKSINPICTHCKNKKETS